MTLVNVVPHVVLHQKTHVLGAENFLGRSNGVPAPCVKYETTFAKFIQKRKFSKSL